MLLRRTTQPGFTLVVTEEPASNWPRHRPRRCCWVQVLDEDHRAISLKLVVKPWKRKMDQRQKISILTILNWMALTSIRAFVRKSRAMWDLHHNQHIIYRTREGKLYIFAKERTRSTWIVVSIQHEQIAVPISHRGWRPTENFVLILIQNQYDVLNLLAQLHCTWNVTTELVETR